MWATHRVHHSPTKFNLTAAIRLGWTGNISGNFLFFLPLAWIGFHPFAVVTMLGINLTYQFFIHTEFAPRLGPLELVLEHAGPPPRPSCLQRALPRQEFRRHADHFRSPVRHLRPRADAGATALRAGRRQAILQPGADRIRRVDRDVPRRLERAGNSPPGCARCSDRPAKRREPATVRRTRRAYDGSMVTLNNSARRRSCAAGGRRAHGR